MSINSEAETYRKKLEEERAITVSVALFGQPGAGKSSLINKIVGQKVAEVGVETDKTVDAASYEANGLRFVDLPGYGTKNFPKDSYFQKFDVNSFDLFLCVSSGKLHQADSEFFCELVKRGKVCIFVVNKHDEIWEDGISIEDLEERKRIDISKHVEQQVKIVFTSCRENTGLDKLIAEIQKNLDNAKGERWMRSAKAYSKEFLERKKQACEKHVFTASCLAAANGLNPIPGADVSVDVGIMLTLFKEIRDDYGLADTLLDKLKGSAMPVAGKLANQVIQFSTKEGILILLKKYAGQQAAKSLAKYIPIVGSLISAGLGYTITSNAGSSYLDDCHKLAEQTLEDKLSIQ